jgi:hypothetical protein
MSNGNVFESLFKVQASINKMVVDGKRKPDQVLLYLQCIVDDSEFISVLDEPPKPVISLVIADGWVAEWQRFYKDVFDFEVSLTDVEIPSEQRDFYWVVMVAPGLILNQVWMKCGERFSTYSEVDDDLDKNILTNDRTSFVAYAKRFRGRVEADEENNNLSANALAARNAQSITLLERLLLELWYHWRTSEHLDLDSITLCAGSRDSNGGVPAVGWLDDRVEIRIYNLDSVEVVLCARSAV